MFARRIIFPKKQSFFLFGARGTGKTSLLKQNFGENSLYIDLLNLDNEARYQLDPESLYRELSASDPDLKVVIIDEIQKVPRLLDVVHRKIEETKLRFILTGSSARKLKLGGANLLAGRAVVLDLYPLTADEIGDEFQLSSALSYGTLPTVASTLDDLERRRYLKAYANTYLKEEVWGEQLVRKIEPFRRFLQVAAQTHGQIVNYSKIARDVGTDDSTVKNYFSILEDTLVGFLLPTYSGSERKQLKTAPKFYYFDNGVKRALENLVDYDLVPGSYEYGIQFEQLVITEILRGFSYRELTVSPSFLATEGGAEIDLVLSRGREVFALVEIKSAKRLDADALRHIVSLKNDFKKARAYCLYGGGTAMEDRGVRVLPWQQGVREILELV